MWLFSAYIITISYKEVLISNLVNVGYEETIDNFDDVLQSGKPVCVPENTLIPNLLFNDPRESVSQLLDNLVYYNFTGVSIVGNLSNSYQLYWLSSSKTGDANMA